MGREKYGERKGIHYEVSIAHNIYRTRVEQLKVIEEEDQLFRVHGRARELVKVGTERILEVIDGGESVCAEPSPDVWERRDTLDFYAHDALLSRREEEAVNPRWQRKSK